jgi:hypothetical protein
LSLSIDGIDHSKSIIQRNPSLNWSRCLFSKQLNECVWCL